ncbi:hypothetical protein KY284_027402 [Solanum tuberosum]|nr:hypothetical protein KY284_027402 [Solanum tuberosum]
MLSACKAHRNPVVVVKSLFQSSPSLGSAAPLKVWCFLPILSSVLLIGISLSHCHLDWRAVKLRFSREAQTHLL